MAKRKISEGGIDSTVVDVKIVLKHALEMMSSGIVLIHNHPSGYPSPSKHDIEITQKVKEAAKFMDISLLDHVIIGQGSYYSFADEEIL